jgi:hypothetical protein
VKLMGSLKFARLLPILGLRCGSSPDFRISRSSVDASCSLIATGRLERCPPKAEYFFPKDWSDRKQGDILTSAELGNGVILKDLIANGTIEVHK